jgi:DNA-binding beta-propeller fold protein YncE
MVIRAFLAVCLLAGCSANGDAAGPTSGEARPELEGEALFVANKRGNSLSRIDLASGEEERRAPTCENPHELAISPDGAQIAVVCYSGSGLEIFRSSDLERLKAVELGAGARPHGIHWHEDGRIFATAEGRNSIFVVADPLSDAPQVREISTEPGGPHMLAVSNDGGTAWGTIIPRGEVVRIDVASGAVTHRRQLGGDTEAIALSPDETSLWVGANASATAYRLDPETLAVEAEVATGPVPIRVLVRPQGDYAVTSNFGDGSLSLIDPDTNAVARTIAISGGEQAVQVTLLFSGDGSRIYAAETGTDTVAEIDFASGEVVRRLPAGEGGDGLAIGG